MKNTGNKKLGLIIIVIYPLISILIHELIKPNYLVSTFIYIGPLAIFLSLKQKKSILAAAIFSFFSLSIFYLFDYMAYMNDAWYVQKSVGRIFGGAIPIEDNILALLWVYTVVLFWEYFLVVGDRRRINTALTFFFIRLAIIIFIGTVVLIVYSPDLLFVPYIYLWIIFLALFPIFIYLYLNPDKIRKVLYLSIFFFYLMGIHEFIGERYGYWSFEGKYYIGKIALLGSRIPIEEILFWLVIAAAATICVYELVMSDETHLGKTQEI